MKFRFSRRDTVVSVSSFVAGALTMLCIIFSCVMLYAPTPTPEPTNTLPTPTAVFSATPQNTATITELPTFTDTPVPPTETAVPPTNVPPTNVPPTEPLPIIEIQPPVDPLQGVTAICKDGTYSYSKTASGTCSHHGGVKKWINKP